MSNAQGQVTVSTTEDLRNALAAGKTADQIIIAGNESAIAAARAEGEAAGREAATADAVTAERARITGITALARVGFEAETQAAIADGTSPEAFAFSLLKAAQDRGITLDAIGRDAPPAAGHANPGNDTGAKAPQLSVTSIYEARRKAGVAKAK